MRADLSPAERAAHQAARKEAYEREFPNTKHGGNNKRPSGQLVHSGGDGYVKHAPKAQEITARTIRRESSTRCGDPGSGTSPDSSVELDALAKLRLAEQEALGARAIAGERVSAKIAVKKLAREEREQRGEHRILT
jgi:hypothetical protein